MEYRFERYCKEYENIENYDKALKDNFKGWEVHHRLETHNSDGKRREVDIGYKELKALGMYYNRPAEELIFLTTREHSVLHTKGKQAWNKGKKMSEETKNKMSEAKKGKRTQTMANIFQKKLKRKCLKQGNGKIFGQKEHIGLIMAK